MKQLLLFTVFLGMTLSVCAQKRDVPLKEYFADAEFFLAAEEYVDALHDFIEVSKRGYENNANINYKIGVCYLNIPGQKNKSIEYLTKASLSASSKYVASTLNEQFAPLDVYLYLGNAYRVVNNLDKAIETYNVYISLLPDVAKEEKGYANKQIEACNIAREYMNNPIYVKFNLLPSPINSSLSNHNCIVSGDGNIMVFMTKLPFYEAILMSNKKSDGNWSRPINITPQLMSDGDQWATGISYDGKTLLLTREDEFDSDILISKFENGQWTKSEPISANINSRFWESHASFSRDGNTIYFTSNRSGGVGEMDIYSSILQENGEWGAPKNLGKGINTSLNEDSPFVTMDGKSLYFSSQGHKNMGGYDFFVAHLNDTGWANPENLLYPLSTTDEDLLYFPWDTGQVAYMQRIADGGLGSWDIYMVDFTPPPTAEEPIAEVTPVPMESEASKIQEPTRVFELEVSPILFGFDNSALSPQTLAELDKYIKLMKDNPTVKLTIVGNTDALGPEEYNQSLSVRRAVSIMKILTKKGIDASRIEVIGMGETQPVAINANPDGSDNPEGRAFNRRAEFKITGIDEKTLLIKRAEIVPPQLRIK